MCCFSGKVEKVADTKIFARATSAGRQFLVYEMAFEAAADLAMILPLPVPPRSGEDAVRFIALDHYATFFLDLQSGFPVSRSQAFALRPAALGAPAPQTLKVVEVGEFEASFVPSRDDFDRLDARFRLPTEVWDDLPAYRDFGFAVFKLERGNRRVHPIAFELPRRDPSKLFFPTVHVHDGEVHRNAHFDHTLYVQGDAPRGWAESYDVAKAFMRGDDGGLVDRAQRVFKHELRGKHANEDQYV
ncbi:MAG TPA: hypothetical protein VL463_36095 [Kofleriaceae bacterium]|nr:hypothetical protein [Kofleriaceae bacterium]